MENLIGSAVIEILASDKKKLLLYVIGYVHILSSQLHPLIFPLKVSG